MNTYHEMLARRAEVVGRYPVEIVTITVPEGVVRRQYEQTASRDHNVTLVAGTYPVQAHRSPEGVLTHYTAAIPAIAEPHYYSTVEWCGRALAGEQRGGELEIWGWHTYRYEISGAPLPPMAERRPGPFTFGTPDGDQLPALNAVPSEA